MNVTDDLKAKYVFGQLTLEEALDLLVFPKAEFVRVVSEDGRHWDRDCFYKVNSRFLIGSNDSSSACFFFSLHQVVRVKNNHILVEGLDDAAGSFYELHFFEKRALNLEFELHKS